MPEVHFLLISWQVSSGRPASSKVDQKWSGMSLGCPVAVTHAVSSPSSED